MTAANPADFQPEVTQHGDDHVMEMTVLDASDILNSTEVEGDELGLSGYVQDNFEFLDQMDCSILDHMDCSVPYQVCVVSSVRLMFEHYLTTFPLGWKRVCLKRRTRDFTPLHSFSLPVSLSLLGE